MSESTHRVLIVEDETMLRNSLRDHFEDMGFEVHTAASGEDGLKFLEEQSVPFCIADMRLPVMDGNEFILAAHETHPDMRFIIHTGSVDYALPRALRDIGLTRDHVFQKPIMDMDILSDAILKMIDEAAS